MKKPAIEPRRRRVGILKPDHLGDLVLSAPAIAALERRFPSLTLFCHPHNASLARHLFPDLEIRPFLMPHLDKSWTLDLDRWRPDPALWQDVELLICLRWDGFVQKVLDILPCPFRAPELAFERHHVVVEQYAVAAPLAGRYDLLNSYRHPLNPGWRRPTELGAVGLCIAAGNRLNTWPLTHWIELAARLHAAKARIVLVGGPAEATRLDVLAEAVRDKTGEAPEIIAGDHDHGRFLQRLVDRVDWLIATDSGTAHLAALVRPVLSLFGGTPWFRFAPFGPDNVVLSRRFPCSPCRAFDRVVMNTCYGQECLVNLTPRHVLKCVDAYIQGVDLSEDRAIDGVWMSMAPWAKPCD